jgi:hypothetical protein
VRQLLLRRPPRQKSRLLAPVSARALQATGAADWVTVAAADSPEPWRSRADYRCSGSGDEAVINDVWRAQGGGPVFLLPGQYFIDSPLTPPYFLDPGWRWDSSLHALAVEYDPNSPRTSIQTSGSFAGASMLDGPPSGSITVTGITFSTAESGVVIFDADSLVLHHVRAYSESPDSPTMEAGGSGVVTAVGCQFVATFADPGLDLVGSRARFRDCQFVALLELPGPLVLTQTAQSGWITTHGFTNCQFQGPASPLLSVQKKDQQDLDFLAVEGCTFVASTPLTDTTPTAIDATTGTGTAHGLRVSGCVFRAPTTRQFDPAIQLDGSSDYAVIVNNLGRQVVDLVAGDTGNTVVANNLIGIPS